MRVLIVGASGVLGRATTRQFIESGHSVIGFVRNEEKARVVESIGARAVMGDLFKESDVRLAAQGSDAILHLATSIPTKSQKTDADWEMNDRIRREGTEILLRVAKDLGSTSYVQQSIAFVYGDSKENWLTEEHDPNPNRVTQSAVDAENLCLDAYRAYAVPIVILRGAMFYGAEAASTRGLLDAIKARRAPILGSGKQYSHFIHVDDMARAVVMASTNPVPGEIFFVADDWPVQAGEFLDFLAEKLGAPKPLQMPVWAARIFGGKTFTFLQSSARYKTDKIKRMLGWSPQHSTYHDGFAQVFAQLGIPF